MYFADGLAVNNIRRVRKIVGLMLAVVMAATVLAIANTEDAGAQPDQANQRAAEFCSAYHLFGGVPVDVAKTADNQTVLAQTSWRWNDSFGCYLVLNPDAEATLRAAGPPASLPQGQTEASRRCSAHHRFGGVPVDVAKTADNQTVLARLSWHSNSIIQCFLVLDPAAEATLRAAAMSPTPTATAPGIPTNVTALAGHRQITVAWTPPADDGGASITSYTVAYRANAFVCPTTLDSAWTQRTTARNTVTLSNLANGTAYLLCVNANNRAGGSGWATASATPASAPGTPTNVNLTGGDGQITATWTAAPDNGARITNYTVQRCNAARGACASTWINAGTVTTTRHTISGLSDGASYGIRIRATNANGPGGWSTTAYESTGTYPPDAPAEVTASIGNRYVTLEWDVPDPNGSPITGYTVECRLPTSAVTIGNCNSSSWITYRTTSSTSITISSLANGTSYDLRVKANNREGSSGWSEVVTATPAATPGTPTNVQADVSGRNIRVTWSAPTSGGAPITRYTVEYCSSTCSATNVSGDPLPTAATLTNLSSGTIYTVRVRAVNVAGEGPWSSSRTASRTPSKPDAPTIGTFTVSTTSVGTATITWSAPANASESDISGYDVALCIGRDTACTDTRGSWRTTTTVPGLSATIENLLASTRYHVRVRATSAAGSSDWSGIRRATTPHAGAPGAPTNVNAAAGNERITVTWTKPTNNGGARITGYTVIYKADASTCPTSLTDWTSATTTSTSYTIRSLDNGDQYHVCVRATNQADEDSSWSSDRATPGTKPSVPTSFTADPGDNRINLSWTSPSNHGGGINGYSVEFRRGNGNWSFVTYVDSTTSKISLDDGSDTRSGVYNVGITNGATYSVRIRANNTHGDSGWNTETVRLPKTPTDSISAARNDQPKELVLTWVTPNVHLPDLTDYATLEVRYKKTSSGACASDWSTSTVSSPSGSTEGDLTTYTFTVQSLEDDTTYRLCIRGVHASYTSSWSDTVSAKTPSKPNKPANLSASAGEDEITLEWSAYTDSTSGGIGPSSYTVQCQFVSGTPNDTCDSTGWSTVTATLNDDDPALATAATVSSLSENATYNLQIRAENAVGNSEYITKTGIKPYDEPDAPKNLAATDGNRKITVKWTAPDNNRATITGYTVAYSTESSCDTNYPTNWTPKSTTSTSYTISNLPGSNTTYTICVRASNKAGDSEWASDTAKPAIKPNKPANLSTSASAHEQITLKWSAYTDSTNGGTDITGYAAQCQLVKGTPSSTCTSTTWADVTITLNGPAATATSGTISGLSADATYNLRIKARNSVSSTEDDNWSTANKVKPYAKPDALVDADLTVTPGDEKVTLKWSAPDNNGATITSYDLAYKVTSSTTCPSGGNFDGWTYLPEISRPSSGRVVSGLINDSAYLFCIRATNKAGKSAWHGESGTPTASG